MRHVVSLLCCVMLAACTAGSRPFETVSSEAAPYRSPLDKVELAIGAPRNMPRGMGSRLAAALAIELQSYGVMAVVQPAEAPVQVGGVMSTRDAGESIEIQIDWRIEGKPATQEPAVSRTRTRGEDYAEATDKLISRIAQQAAPRIATLIGRPPSFQPRSPGQIAAGVSVPLEPADMTTAAPGVTPVAATTESQVKVMVAAITGAPSDGNRQLYSGMRRALGSSKIVVVDTPGTGTFTVVGTVSLTPIDEKVGKLVVKWVLKDPAGQNVGDIEQSNPVPLAAARGSWAGFGDIVATAASEGVLELLNKALNQPR
ncbi:hypothetical protein [Reyranella sp.]|uniref:hypothetical protein n=1 Tax=Reyranella sp. TaxID=1929291 RepID=UPI002731A202|nr:hypothetical protein [Reyranella sp.]MDP2375092.1 hypothetical protein [Reyranella sp.]